MSEGSEKSRPCGDARSDGGVCELPSGHGLLHQAHDRDGRVVKWPEFVDVEEGLSVDDLRRKAIDGSPVFWQGAYGIVTRVAKNGAWADMVWWQGPPQLSTPAPGCPMWRKRQPLARLEEWRHG